MTTPPLTGINDVFLWDPSQRVFKPSPVCPYHACGVSLRTLGASGLGRCQACGGLYEAVRLTSPFEDVQVEWARRAGSRYCSLTGARLTAASLLDWPETGGTPGRNHCTPDMLGQVFGAPHDRVTMTMAARAEWSATHVIAQRVGAWDAISSLSIVKGALVAVTRRGAVAVVDANTGAVNGQCEWPSSTSINPEDAMTAVEFSPAAIDTHLVAVAPGGALFRDLAYELGFESQPARARMVRPTRKDAVFAAAPMTIPGESPFFCLLEFDSTPLGIADARLRFFTPTGVEVARQSLGFVPARPPLFHPAPDQDGPAIILIDEQGNLHAIRTRDLPVDPPQPDEAPLELTEIDWLSAEQAPHELPRIRASTRPTFVYAENDAGEVDLWLLQGGQGEASLYRTGLREAMSSSRWKWDHYPLRGCSGEPNGLAVGRGAPDLHGAGNLLAFCTDQGAYVFQKSSRDDSPLDAIVGPDGRGTRGSHDPPVLCGAGMLVRMHSRLALGLVGTPWSGTFNTEGRIMVQVVGDYRYAQGMVCLGPTVYVGAGLSIQAFDIQVNGAT